MRLAIEIVESGHRNWPAHKPLFMRLSIDDDAGLGPARNIVLASILKSRGADLIGVGREIMHNPNWPLDAAQKLGLESAFDQVPQQTGYCLAAPARRGFGCSPSTWQAGLDEA